MGAVEAIIGCFSPRVGDEMGSWNELNLTEPENVFPLNPRTLNPNPRSHESRRYAANDV